MKALLLLISILFCQAAVGQNFNCPDWEVNIAKQFYNTVSAKDYFKCCDFRQRTKQITFVYRLPEKDFDIDEFRIQQITEDCIDSAKAAEIADHIVHLYTKKFSKRQRSRFKASGYNTIVTTQMLEDVFTRKIVIVSNIEFTYFFQ